MVLNNNFSSLGSGFGNNFQSSTGNTKISNKEKFKGLSNAQIKRLEEQTSSLTGATKDRHQQALYQQMITQIQKENYNGQRKGMENGIFYDSLSEKDNNKKNNLQSNVRLEQLADVVKDWRGLDASADTVGVIQGLAGYMENNGLDVELINKYLQKGDEELLYQLGIEERPEETLGQKVAQVGTDIVGGAYDSVTGLARMGGKGAASAIGWAAKKLGADEDKVNELVNDYKNYVDEERSGKSIGADEDSFAYNASKMVGDLAQVATAEGLAKNAIKGTANGAKMISYLENAPTWQKMVAGGLEGAGDMALYSIVSEGKLPTSGELGIGSAIGAAIPWAGALYKVGKQTLKKAAPKIAAKLELNSMLNPAKLTNIKNQLITEGTDIATSGLKGGTAEDVGTWLVERGFKGDKESIVKSLKDYSKKSHDLKREVLGASNTLHNVESADKALEVVYNTIKDTPGLEQKAARIEELMAKGNKPLTELDEIRGILGDTLPIYKNSGEVGAGATKEGLSKIYNDLKTYIEKAAEQEGLGNVKMLNNETQISHSLAEAISKKEDADMVRDFLSIYGNGLVGGFAGSQGVGVFDNNTITGKIGNTIVGAIAGKYLFSTKAKTSLANAINKMSGGAKKELERYLTDGATKLSKSTERELSNVFKALDDVKMPTAKEFTEDEYKALLSRYSKEDLPALGFKEGVENYNTIIGNDSKKIIADAEGNAVREGQIGEINKPVSKSTDSASFKERFGDYKTDPAGSSKVVDNNGNPLLLFHGSPNKFDRFDIDMVGKTTDYGMRGDGIYFTDTKSTANLYNKGDGAIHEVYLNMKNPLEIDKNTIREELANYLDISERWLSDNGDVVHVGGDMGPNIFSSALRDKGHDGVIITHPNGRKEFVTFDIDNILDVTNV